MTFEDRLEVFYVIIRDNEPISRDNLGKKLLNRQDFRVDDVDVVDEVIRVELLFGRLQEDHRDRLMLSDRGIEWLNKH